MSELAKLVDRIKSTHEDIRAEVIISDLLAGDVHIDDLFIRFIGQLKRPRSQDIADAQVVRNNNKRDQLKITLNRDSIYDTLPEGVFHQPSTGEPSVLVPAMVDEYKQQQKEEAEARQFFAPFENELFFQRSFIDSEEFRQLFRIQQSRLEPDLLDQLGIDTGLPKDFTAKLVRILPYLSKITGNISQTEEIFSLLLNDTLSIRAAPYLEPINKASQPRLGHSTLGVDLTAGDSVMPSYNIFRLTIGPLCKATLFKYKDGGWKSRALQTLLDFMIPVEWDISVDYTLHQEDATSFILNDAQTDALLGYTTSLQE